MSKPSKHKLTAIIERVEKGYVGYIAEIGGVNTQGETIKEVKENLLDALLLTIEARKDLATESH